MQWEPKRHFRDFQMDDPPCQEAIDMARYLITKGYGRIVAIDVALLYFEQGNCVNDQNVELFNESDSHNVGWNTLSLIRRWEQMGGGYLPEMKTILR